MEQERKRKGSLKLTCIILFSIICLLSYLMAVMRDVSFFLGLNTVILPILIIWAMVEISEPSFLYYSDSDKIFSTESVWDKIKDLTTGEDKLLRTWLVLRRRFFLKFRMKYVLESISKRKGNCTQNGCCCKSTSCKYLDQNNICKIWKEKGFNALPLNCQLYPFDEKDKLPNTKEICGFYWSDDFTGNCTKCDGKAVCNIGYRTKEGKNSFSQLCKQHAKSEGIKLIDVEKKK